MAMFFHLDLVIYYMDESGFAKRCFSFANSETASAPKIQLYLSPDGGFDTIYSKSYIKSAGICQSLFFEVFVLLANLDI